jgi:hypothetical protein
LIVVDIFYHFYKNEEEEVRSEKLVIKWESLKVSPPKANAFRRASPPIIANLGG